MEGSSVIKKIKNGHKAIYAAVELMWLTNCNTHFFTICKLLFAIAVKPQHLMRCMQLGSESTCTRMV